MVPNLLQKFDLEERKGDIEAVVRDNTFMAELQASVSVHWLAIVLVIVLATNNSSFGHGKSCWCMAEPRRWNSTHTYAARGKTVGKHLCRTWRLAWFCAGADCAAHRGARHLLAALLLPPAPAQGDAHAARSARRPRRRAARGRGV